MAAKLKQNSFWEGYLIVVRCKNKATGLTSGFWLLSADYFYGQPGYPIVTEDFHDLSVDIMNTSFLFGELQLLIYEYIRNKYLRFLLSAFQFFAWDSIYCKLNASENMKRTLFRFKILWLWFALTSCFYAGVFNIILGIFNIIFYKSCL